MTFGFSLPNSSSVGSESTITKSTQAAGENHPTISNDLTSKTAIMSWKCQCCDAQNTANAATCKDCLVTRPMLKANDDIASTVEPTKTVPAPTTGFVFAGQATHSVTSEPSVPASGFVFGGQHVAMPTTTPHHDIASTVEPTKTVPAPTTGFVFAGQATHSVAPEPSVPASGFVFGGQHVAMPTTSTVSFAATTGEHMAEPHVPSTATIQSDKWKCPCCEAENASDAMNCRDCLISNPIAKKKQLEIKTDITEEKQQKAEDQWSCICCDTKNDATMASCSMCSVARSVSQSSNPMINKA